MSTVLTETLAKFSGADWLAAVEELLPCIHEVDRAAVQIWFRFYPLELKRFIDAAEDREATLNGIVMKGEFELAGQIDTSHHFLYGHRYWPAVKCKIEKLVEEYKGEPASLVELIKDVSMRVSEKVKADRTLTNAIAAAGLMTLNQVGIDAFRAAKGEVAEPAGLMRKSPDAIVVERNSDDSQGFFGFLKTVDKKFTVAFQASAYAGKLPVILDQEVVSAAQSDHSQDWQSKDDRCWDGPIPIECTSASCGTCWVGVLGGAEKLGQVKPRERRAMKVFGYDQPADDAPFIRLACQTRAQGNATLVIPPWNAVFGKKVYNNVDEVVLEPNTTSAKRLREIVRSATSGE